jgi:RNA polymerase sigma-70 factor, ECF subfamily
VLDVSLTAARSDFATTLAAAKGGSEAALSSLYRSLQPEVLAYLRRRAREQADDLSSEVWLAVTRGVGSFSGDEAGFRGWVFTIARRRLIDARRQNARRPTSPLSEVEGIASEDEPESAVVGAAAAEAMLAALPRDQAKVVQLRVLDGLSVEQAAAVLGKRPGTVRVLHHRGLRRLGKLVVATVCAMALMTGLALGGVLPRPVEHVAREILDRVGVGALTPAEAATRSPDVLSRPGPADTRSMRIHSPSTPAGSPAGGQADSMPDRVGPKEALTPSPSNSDTATVPSSPSPPSDGGGETPMPPPDGESPPGLDGEAPPGYGGTPPGLDGAVPPGQGATPPGRGGTPPGQAKKLFAEPDGG